MYVIVEKRRSIAKIIPIGINRFDARKATKHIATQESNARIFLPRLRIAKMKEFYIILTNDISKVTIIRYI